MTDTPFPAGRPKAFYWFLALSITGLLLSAIRPHDYFTWWLEVLPAIIAMVVIFTTGKKFPLSDLLYILILIHCFVLYLGGHYTYAEVPLFNWVRDVLHQSRNNYDKVGHFIQGFVPCIVARELLIRHKVINKLRWLPFLCVSICLAISALYELIEALVAILTGDSAEAFLGTQGYVWDTQSDMFLAVIGAITALIFLSRLHNRSMSKVISVA
jgi:putative membrane protein